jgi:hypothetical protein
MLGYTQEMLVPANEAKIEARDAGTTTTRRRQLTSEFSYSPEVRLSECGFGCEKPVTEKSVSQAVSCAGGLSAC